MKNYNTSMTHNFSLYLDIVRFLASLAVFLEHISSKPFTNNFFYSKLGLFGGVAVIIFFVLSGYVIAYVTSTRETTIAKYASARIARIYSVVLIALFITIIFDNIGLYINPDFYSIQKVMWKPQSIEGYVSSLFFVNEYQIFNFNGISPGTNGPYWSLSFEITYYVIAGLLIFSRKIIALPVSIIILILAGKTIAALLPIWLTGYFLYFFKIEKSNKLFMYILAILSLLLISVTPYFIRFFPADFFGFYFPWGRGSFNRNILIDYLTALFFSVHLISVKEILKDYANVTNRKLESIARWLGSLTFPLYLVHFPAICFFFFNQPMGK